MLKENKDKSDIFVEELSYAIINIYKLCIEEMGYDFCETKNDIEYHNFLINNPIILNGPGLGYGDPLGVPGSPGYIGGGAVTLEGFKNLNVELYAKYAAGGYLTNINSVIKNRTINIGAIPKFFIDTAIEVGKKSGVPPAFFILISASEAGFRDCGLIKVSKGACGGYFGNNYLFYPSHGAPLAEQMKGPIKSWNDAKRCSPGAGMAELLALGYMCHHLPAVGTKYWKVTGGRIWNINPDYIANNCIKCYPDLTKYKVTLAEAISTCVSAQYMSKQLISHKEFF